MGGTLRISASSSADVHCYCDWPSVVIAYMHTYIHTYIHEMQARIHTYIEGQSGAIVRSPSHRSLPNRSNRAGLALLAPIHPSCIKGYDIASMVDWPMLGRITVRGRSTAAGYQWWTIPEDSVCLSGPQDAYCPAGSPGPTACPANTAAAAGSADLISCTVLGTNLHT